MIKTPHGEFNIRPITFGERRELHRLEMKVFWDDEIEKDAYFDLLNWCMTSDEVLFPFGLVIARESSVNDGLFGKELYTVRFGPNQYDKVHPIELEVVR